MNPQNSPTSSGPTGATGSAGSSTEISGTDTKSRIAQTARQTASNVKDEAERVATQQKQSAANRIGEYSSAIHESAKSLEEKDPNIAWFTHRAADRVQSIADYMRNRDFSALRHDVENMARRHPAAFFGGMFVAGLVLGNIVKASRRNMDDT